MKITRRYFCGSVAGATAGAAMPRSLLFGQEQPAEGGSNGRPRPTPEQLAWQDMELGLFIHFEIVTFTGQAFPRTPIDPNRYNPVKLDTDQWLEAAKAIGAKYAVFVAKHSTSFLQWQSNAWPYGVKQSSWRNGKGDVVKDFIASCKKYDIRPGIYAQVMSDAFWNVNQGRVNGGKGGDPKRQAEYAKACEAMLTELWSNYGELTEIWFDGGVLPVEQGGPDVVPLLKRYQPKAMVFQGPAATIRWIGNEEGVASYPCWATAPEGRDVNGPGDPNGPRWLPGECDVPLPGHTWIWVSEQDPNTDPAIRAVAKAARDSLGASKPLDKLMQMYYKSVGRNCNLLLNAGPDPTGLIPEADLKHYADFGKEIRRRFSKPVAETAGKGAVVELALKKPGRIDQVMIMEDIRHGERVRAYEIEGLVLGNSWQRLCDGVSIGHKRIQQFAPLEVAKVRLRVTESVAVPQIRRLAVFDVDSDSRQSDARQLTSPAKKASFHHLRIGI